MFGAFNLFWTAAALMLATKFGLNGAKVGCFSLTGAGGVLAAPFEARQLHNPVSL